MNRAAIAIVGSAFAVALGILELKTAWQAIDPSTIVFLLGMMVVNSALGASGFFQLAKRVFNSLHSFPRPHFSRRYFWQRDCVGIFSRLAAIGSAFNSGRKSNFVGFCG